MTFDDLDFEGDPGPANLGAPEPLRCARHRWGTVTLEPGQAIVACLRCARPKDEAKSRAGRNSRGRGLSIQRATLRRMGLRHIPGSQLLDGDNDAFTAEVKSGGRFNGADYHEITKQRAVSGTRMPLLIKVETPGGGRRARGTVTVDLDDWIANYGPVTLPEDTP